ncbi:hypothetical protein FOXYSP1_09742 [Fusarium oxysporum f. sp. phaseoli]
MSQVREGDSRETRDGLPDQPILAPSFLFSLFCRIMWICWIRIKIIVELFILWFVYMNVLNTTYTLLRNCVLCCYMQSIIGCQDITRYQDSKTTYTQPQPEKNIKLHRNKISQQSLKIARLRTTHLTQVQLHKMPSLHHVTKVKNSLVTEP